MNEIIYIRLFKTVELQPKSVIRVKDIAQLIGNDVSTDMINEMIIYHISKQDKTHVNLDIMYILQKIKREHPLIDWNIVGSTQTLVKIQVEKRKVNILLFILVWLLLFVGAGLAIIYFHEDVSMQQVHQRIYYMITGEFLERPLLLQIPYSFGLGLGMILFFNHVFKKRINEEPSPLEVEMFQYQQSLDEYIISNDELERISHRDHS